VPMFRVRRYDGTDRTVEADRVLTDTLQTIFEDRHERDWEVVLSPPNETVAGVLRRITESDGRRGWVVERPQRALGNRHRRAAP
jgi:hypothetical protein